MSEWPDLKRAAIAKVQAQRVFRKLKPDLCGVHYLELFKAVWCFDIVKDKEPFRLTSCFLTPRETKLRILLAVLKAPMTHRVSVEEFFDIPF